jgi:hypothetical protein
VAMTNNFQTFWNATIDRYFEVGTIYIAGVERGAAEKRLELKIYMG